MKNLTAIILSAAAAFSILGTDVYAEEGKGVVILHTNDVHCGVDSDDNSFGAAELAAYKARLESEGYDVIMADAGDFVQGGIIGTLSEGKDPLQIMNMLGYDVAVPGNHEFDFGVDNFFMLSENADFTYLSANFTDAAAGERLLDSYKVIDTDEGKIGFVGITTPATPTSSRPTYFKDENGEAMYSFCGGDDGRELYAAVQEAVDGALSEGAEHIIVVGHMGDYVYDECWSSQAVIKNVSGIDVFIDGHSHSVLDNETVADKDGKNVILASAGTKLEKIGAVTLSDDTFTAKLIGKADYTVTDDETSEEYKAYSEMKDYIAKIDGQYEEIVNTAVAKTAVDLTINDPDTGERAVRSAETNMGDLCADAYRIKSGADIGLINGGGVRSDIAAGDITYGDIISVQPFGNSLCVVEVSGQQILDALETGAMYCPEESGGFMQVSGLTYEVHTYIPSSVKTDEDGNFVKVDGEYRVKNVMVSGEPLDLSKTYTLASHNYMLLSGGDGMTMFSGCNVIAREIMLDNQMLIEYIKDDLGGSVGEEYSDPCGSGRIKLVTEAPAESIVTVPETTAESTGTVPKTGNAPQAAMLLIMAAAAAIGAVSKKNDR